MQNVKKWAFRVGAGLAALLVISIGLFTWAGADGINSFRAKFWRYDVVGVVQGQPMAKTFAGGQGGESKFSVNLQTADGPRIVNCSSTQCASLLVNQRVRLSCFDEFHAWEPNEEECRFDKLLTGT